MSLAKVSKIVDHDFLDVLRGIAVIMVVSIHSGFMFFNATSDVFKQANEETFKWLLDVARLGSAGPMLFFIISGFLMSMLYASKYEPRLFFKRRFYRIMPLWIVFSIFAAVSSLAANGYGDAPNIMTVEGVGGLLLNVTFLSMLFASLWDYVPGGWSIQGEMVNYGMFHLIKKHGLNIIILIQIFVSGVTLFVSSSSELEYVTVPLQIVSTATFWFIVGIVMADYLKNNNPLNKSGIVLLAGMVFINLFNNAPNMISEILSLLAIVIAVAIGLVTRFIKPVSVAIQTVGKYSYGIYLMHFLILSAVLTYATKLNVLEALNPIIGWLVIIVIVTALTLLLAVPIYKYFELPFIRAARTYKHENK